MRKLNELSILQIKYLEKIEFNKLVQYFPESQIHFLILII